MGRASTKENKSVYQLKREELGLTRDAASNRLAGLSPERIEKIENGKTQIHPEDIVIMADGYEDPHLCNYYCSNECPIGRKYVPEIKMADLSQIVLETVNSVNVLYNTQDRLIDIAVDGSIDNDELEDFIYIQNELEKASIAVETLQLWCEKMLSSGAIDKEEYERLKAGTE